MPKSQMICYRCKRKLTENMRIEYDKRTGRYYCSSGCALADGVEIMGSGINPKNEILQKSHHIRIGRNGFLFSQE